MSVKKLREKFELENTGTRYLDDFRPSVSVNVEEGDSIGWEGFGERFEYDLTLTVGAKFRANSVEREEAQRHCEALVIRTLYSDLLRKTAEIRNAIMSGSKEAAFTALEELESFYI